MSITTGVRVSEGLVALEEAPTRLAEELDRVCVRWAETVGAVALTVPPLLPVADLAGLDVYQNFPQLALVSSALDITAAGTGRIEEEAAAGTFGPGSLREAGLALPSSACYGVYLHHRGGQVPSDGKLVTLLGQCFRNEDHFDGLRRLKAFRMREVVALGTPDQVSAHLERSAHFLDALAEAIGLPLERRAARDPFYDRTGDRAAFQEIVPVKHEYVHQELAVASVNTHHTFFGERCGIHLPDGGPVSTGCVGFGIERWLHSLALHFAGDWERARAAVEKAGETLL
jgi:seryl-tRNA synthetase